MKQFAALLPVTVPAEEVTIICNTHRYTHTHTDTHTRSHTHTNTCPKEISTEETGSNCTPELWQTLFTILFDHKPFILSGLKGYVAGTHTHTHTHMCQ